jgi:hypothetical protein
LRRSGIDAALLRCCVAALLAPAWRKPSSLPAGKNEAVVFLFLNCLQFNFQQFIIRFMRCPLPSERQAHA